MLTPAGAILAGAVGGVLMVYAVSFFDRIRVDDPVGAISVHGICGAWGTLAVGLLAPEIGLLTGGGSHQLAVQATGVVAVLGWTVASTLVALALVKVLVPLRVSQQEEIEGLDAAEHGMMAYGDLTISAMSNLRHQVNAYTRESRIGRGLPVMKGGEAL